MPKKSTRAGTGRGTRKTPRADDALSAHLSALQAAFDAAPFGVWARDRRGRILMQNAVTRRLWGNQLGRTPKSSGAHRDVIAAWQRTNRLVLSGRTVREEVEYRVRDQVRFFQNIVSPLRVDGRIVGLLGFLVDITERKHSENALRESEQRFRAIADNALDAIFVKNAARRYTYLNPAAVRLLGRPARKLIGRTPEEVFDKDGARVVRATDDATFAGEPLDAERSMTLSGRVYHLHTVQMPIRSPDGGVPAICGIVRDVTSRREAERRVIEDARYYRLMAEAVPMLAFQCDADGGLLEANRRWYAYTGQTHRQARGRGWMAALHPNDRARVARNVRNAVKGGQVYQTDYRLRRASDGQYRWHMARALPYRDSAGTITAWFGAAADIHAERTAKEQFERQVVERTAALAASEARLKRILESGSDGYWEWDVKVDCVFASPRFREIFGLGAESSLLTREDVRRTVHPDDLAQVSETVRRSVGTPGGPDHYALEHRHLRPGGRLVWVQSRATVTERDANGFGSRVVGMVTDITDRKRANELVLQRSRQLAQLASELTLSEHRERRRIAELLHDHLQQLLVAARMQAHSLASAVGAPNRPQLDALCGTLGEALDSARAVTRDIAPPVLLHKDLSAAFQWLAHDMLARHGLTVAVRVGRLSGPPAEPLTVLLFTAARELLLNVVKHAETPEAALSLRRRRDRIELAVEDRGKGASPEALRAHPDLQGFGLFSIRERTELLGGTVELDSAPGRGTRVVISLPFSRSSAAASPEERTAAARGHLPTGRRRGSALP